MNKWKIGAFYTKNTKYEDLYKFYLQKSAIQLNLEVNAIEVNNEKDWYKNVANKPRIIKEMLENMPQNECLVFLDVDSEIKQYPKLFDEIPEDCDIGFHLLDWNSHYGYKHNPSIKEVLSGTLFLRNNDRIKNLCDKWFRGAYNSKIWEQKVLQKLLEIESNIKTYLLPIEYCFINSRPRNLPPLEKCKPIIVHYQASREMKKKVML